MSVIKWEDPPQVQRHREYHTVWPQIFDQVRQRPGQWALVRDDASAALVTHIRRGARNGSTPGEFDARIVLHRMPDGSTHRNRGALYIRYVGGDAS